MVGNFIEDTSNLLNLIYNTRDL